MKAYCSRFTFIFDSLHQLLAQLLPFEFLKMASQLNIYCNLIDIQTKEGQALVSNVIDKFTSPLLFQDRISLIGTNFQKLKDNIYRLGFCFGYDYLYKHCATVIMFIPEVIADLHNGIVGVPKQLYYANPINMLEKYSDGNIELSQKHASLTWGDCSFTFMHANTINNLTAANGFMDATGKLTDSGKELILKRMQSKFLGHHLLELLTDSAHQAIEQ
jgi:hypothetical protein